MGYTYNEDKYNAIHAMLEAIPAMRWYRDTYPLYEFKEFPWIIAISPQRVHLGWPLQHVADINWFTVGHDHFQFYDQLYAYLYSRLCPVERLLLGV